MTGQGARDEAARRYPHWERPEPGDPDPDYSEIDASWQDAEADDRRAAFVAGWEAALSRKPPESEWEYGRITKTQWAHPQMGEPSVAVLANTEGNVEYQRNLGYMIVRRHKAGPWVPVGEGEQG